MKRHWVGTGIFLGILCLALFLGKVAFNSYEEYRQGEEAARQGDFKKAILHYDRSIHWYTPWDWKLVPEEKQEEVVIAVKNMLQLGYTDESLKEAIGWTYSVSQKEVNSNGRCDG